MKVFMDKGGTAENQNKTYGPWSCFLDGWMDGLQPLLTSLSPCPAFAFSRLRTPNPSLSAARHKLHIGRGLVSNKPWAKILAVSLALLVTPSMGLQLCPSTAFHASFPVCKRRGGDTHPTSMTRDGQVLNGYAAIKRYLHLQNVAY